MRCQLSHELCHFCLGGDSFVTGYRLEILHGYDVNPRADPWTFVHEEELGLVEASLRYTGDLPLPCIEECAEDPNCHGTVLTYPTPPPC